MTMIIMMTTVVVLMLLLVVMMRRSQRISRKMRSTVADNRVSTPQQIHGFVAFWVLRKFLRYAIQLLPSGTCSKVEPAVV